MDYATTLKYTPTSPQFKMTKSPIASRLLLSAVAVYAIFTGGITSFVLESPVAIGFYIGPGVAWIAGALMLWRKRYAYAILLVLIGFSIPVALQP